MSFMIHSIEKFFFIVCKNKVYDIINSLSTGLTRFRPQFEIFWSVIIAYSVLMVYTFKYMQIPPKHFFHDNAMFVKLFISNSFVYVPASHFPAPGPSWVIWPAIMLQIAFSTTKNSGFSFNSRWREVSFFAASIARAIGYFFGMLTTKATLRGVLSPGEKYLSAMTSSRVCRYLFPFGAMGDNLLECHVGIVS